MSTLVYKSITAKVTFKNGSDERWSRNLTVNNCSFSIGCDLLEKMIEALEDANHWNAIKVEFKTKR